MQLAQSIADLRYGGFPMNPNPNAFRNGAEQQMGLLALDAFHRKDVGALKQLMDQGAPAGARLDCALSLRLEADFVAALKVILGGDRTTDAPVEKIQQAFDYTPETAAAIQTYTRDAFVIRDILCAAENQASIPLAPEFIEHVLNNAAGFRDSLGNSSLMTATSMIDQHAVPVNAFIVKLLRRGVAVDFQGYFGCTASMWSVILTDIPRVALLLEHGASIDAVDFAGNGLLHWASATAAIDHTSRHRERAERMIAWLIDHGANEQRTNKLGLMASAYFDSLR